ncbi:LPS export ABC transporter periplasmic protein LptC [Alteraurantiacibacter aestuarii]|uniref:LPS export ABC transporter periplasmic protein LptC n=1 Tax=Alteraurantiacibacter aestuarii TaxID=650004 RepID=A0A844ZM71_9SPHN|nr:LPS export ABC transporter periplasmic protein LptC [Alteraurantiacibacter aestuarii]MXO88412.1 LPS export ABC transporter periplasmic protein LptC [Alteraurantiacibacter aestuarii]
MTVEADKIRSRRQAFAAPGSRLDTMVRVLAIGLPALVGVVAAMMLITPLSPRGEVSFLLDRNKVAIAEDRLRVDNAMYRGEDSSGRPFSLAAGDAVQTSRTVPVVEMHDLVARIILPEGPAVLTADTGTYAIDKEQVGIPGVVEFTAADGYHMVARNVVVDLPTRSLVSDGRVEGSIPAGTFEADSLRANLAERTLSLIGNARLRMVPSQLRLPRGVQ